MLEEDEEERLNKTEREREEKKLILDFHSFIHWFWNSLNLSCSLFFILSFYSQIVDCCIV